MKSWFKLFTFGEGRPYFGYTITLGYQPRIEIARWGLHHFGFTLVLVDATFYFGLGYGWGY